MSRLTEYRRKRDFAATPEPAVPKTTRAAKKHAAGKRLGFVVQLHHASHRHFDFRLEYEGSLRSWAVPKGPSLDPSFKRLAVEVEDHPLDYAAFEGDIPEGHYGAGHVDLWDRGEWQPDGDPAFGFDKGHLAFELFGTRLHGHWDLIRTRLAGSKQQWLLVKRDDAFVVAGDVADDTPLREVVPQAAAKKTVPKQARRSRSTPSARVAKSDALPSQVGLQLARLEARAPAGSDWLHEVKYDGYRALLSRSGEGIRITSRNGIDWTAQLPALAKAVIALPCRSAIIDTELVVIDDAGRSRFDLLQARFSDKSGSGVTAIAFDLLFLDGNDLRPLPQVARKQALAHLLADARSPLSVAGYLEGNGPEAAKAACEAGLEGIVSKQREAPYEEGRGGAWLKVKCVDAGEYAVVGYTAGKGARAALGSLLIAEPATDRKAAWRYFGRVGSGLDDALIDTLLARLKPAKKPVALENPPSRADLRGAAPVWVTPGVVVEVEHRGLTGQRLLRQASIKALRIDKSLRSLRAPDEAPKVSPVNSQGKSSAKTRASTTKTKTASRSGQVRKSGVEVESYPFTHPERLLFEKPKITKRQLGDFYASVAGLMLPELVHRPLSVIRCPDGATGQCFFQKHSSPGFTEAIRELPIAGSNSGVQDYFYIENLEGLLGLVQMNCIELHPWGSRVADFEKPDRLVFDLDPAPDVKWKRVVSAALLLRDRLEQLELRSFVRTSGGKGLHVVVPLTPRADWDTAKAFTQAMAQTLATEQPEEFVAVATKKLREGRIFIDYLRNGRGATSVASYSVRAREGAPVSTPLAWEELPKLRSGAQYTLGNFHKRLAALAGDDPWKNLAMVRQTLPASGGENRGTRKRRVV